MRTQTKETQQSLTPQKAFEILKEGNKRFINNYKANRNLLQQVNETSDGQYPFAVILSCIDSRTSAELIFDQGLGDIFSVRIAGNVVNDDILGSMEFACKLAGSKLIVVMGHTNCGAIKGACSGAELGHLTTLLKKVQPAVDAVKSGKLTIAGDLSFQEQVAKANVMLALEEIKSRSAILNELIEAGTIGLVGGMHNIANGEVTFFEEKELAAVKNMENVVMK